MKKLFLILIISFLFLANQVFSQLSAPTNPYPPDGGSFYTYEHHFSWAPVTGAEAYQYVVNYNAGNPPPEEANPLCASLAGNEIVPATITSSPSAFVSLSCLGAYHWSVRACADRDCAGVGPWSSFFAFSYIQPAPETGLGIVPCGRLSDDPSTPWNERDPCEFKHFFMLLKNVLDLILWRIGLIILVFLILTVGIMFYFSLGALETLAQVKSLLRSAGHGYLLLFLAWLLVNVALKILQVPVRWWLITF